MPAAIAIDHDVLRVAYCKGVPLSELASQHGIKLVTLRSIAVRQGWTQDRAKSASIIQKSANTALAGSADRWVSRIDTYVNRSLDGIEMRDANTLKPAELKTLLECAAIANTMARSNLKLDADSGNGAGAKLAVQINVGSSQVDSQADAQTIEAEASVADSSPADT